MSSHQGRPEVSVVVPVFNEEESIPGLIRELTAALRPTGRGFEIVLVDDGSSDRTWELIEAHRAATPELSGIKLSSNRGQTPALMAGLQASRGEIVVTMDGDLQNDPADIPKLLAKLEEGNEIVSGWRKSRKDKLLSRRFPSVVANRLARWLTGITIHDNGCALKAYRGSLVRSVELYSDFHRFIVPLAQMGGARVAEVVTNHRARQFGSSKYGLSRIFKVMADLLTLIMVTRFSGRLMVWFLIFAIPLFLLAQLAFVWTAVVLLRSPETPLLVPMGSCVLLFQSFLGIVGYGFFAERIRHLAVTGRSPGERMVGRIRTPHGEETVMIRNNRMQRLSHRIG